MPTPLAPINVLQRTHLLDTYLTTIANSGLHPLSQAVGYCLRRTILEHTSLDADVLAIEGMSGRKYRMFINQLIGSIANPRYLEIGVWQGSTLCSAIHKNKVRALAIDNWTEYGGPAREFFANLARFRGDADVSFLEADFRAVDYSRLEKFNVYMFDGPHEEKDQYDGLALVQPALDDHFIFIVDDWNWPGVRQGTRKAIETLGLQLDFVAEIRTTLDDTQPAHQKQFSDWHNGYFLAACSKAHHLQPLLSAHRPVVGALDTPFRHQAAHPEARRESMNIHSFLTDLGLHEPYAGLDIQNARLDLQGWGSDHHFFQTVVGRTKPKLIIEVGTWKGASAINMARSALLLEPEAIVLCVDTWLGSNEVLWSDPEMRTLLQLEHGRPSVYRQFLANVILQDLTNTVFPLPMTSVAAAELLRRFRIQADLIYIDAGHGEYEVYGDLQNYWSLLRPSGILFGDDYDTAWQGVVRAVNRFAAETGLLLETDHGKWAITKPS